MKNKADIEISVDLNTRISYKNASGKHRWIEASAVKYPEGNYRWIITHLAWEAMMWGKGDNKITVDEYHLYEDWMDEIGHDILSKNLVENKNTNKYIVGKGGE